MSRQRRLLTQSWRQAPSRYTGGSSVSFALRILPVVWLDVLSRLLGCVGSGATSGGMALSFADTKQLHLYVECERAPGARCQAHGAYP